MKFSRIAALIPFLISAVFPDGKRNFVGTNMNYFSEDAYQARPGASLLYYDNFNNDDLDPAWQAVGNLEFYGGHRILNVPVTSRKRTPKAGSLTLRKPVEVGKSGAKLAVNLVIPNDDPNIASSLYFAPADCGFDESGHPDAYVRYFKRAQLELIEAKPKGGAAQLIWGRNEKVNSGASRRCALEINAKEITLTVNDAPVYHGKNALAAGPMVAGLWVSTKGKNFTGGSVEFDNFALEEMSLAQPVKDDEVLPVETKEPATPPSADTLAPSAP